MLAEAADNTDEDPKMMPDKDFFEKFSNFVASKPGKLNMDGMNEWRRSVGLNLQAEPGSARKNYGMAYPLAAVIPGLVSKVPGKGVQLNGPFAAYSGGGAAAGAASLDADGGAAAPAKDYAEAAFASFKKGVAGVRDLADKAVKVKVGVGSKDTKALLKNAPAADYQCVKLLAPGAVEPTMDVVYGYLLKGTPAAKDWDKFLAKKDKYKDGVTVKGTAWYVGSDNYAYPVGIIIDEVSAE